MSKLSFSVGLFLCFSAYVECSDFWNLSSTYSIGENAQIAKPIIQQFMKKWDIPSLLVGVSVKNKIFHKSAFGYMDLENDVPTDIRAMHRMASVSKTFTSLLIGTLVESGKLSYEDSIYKHLPPAAYIKKLFDGKAVDITIGQTLSMMGGLPLSGLADYYDLHFPSTCTETLKQLSSKPLIFQPGTDFVYSNYGFQVLGAIVENATNKAFPIVMDSFIRHVLKLSDGTMAERAGTLLHHHPRPKYYQADNDQKVTSPVGVFDDAMIATGIWPAGGLLSTVDDMLLYGSRVLDIYHQRPNAIMKKETLSTILTRRTGNAPSFPAMYRPSTDYGYGWAITNVTESVDPKLKHLRFRIFHDGDMYGVSTFFAIYPEEEIVIVAMANKGSITEMDQFCIQMVEGMVPIKHQ